MDFGSIDKGDKNIIVDGGKFIDTVGFKCHSIFKCANTLFL